MKSNIRNDLLSEGFTLAPNSAELVAHVKQIPDETLLALRQGIAAMQPDLHSSEIVQACMQQIRQVLPSEFVVLGLYKPLHRRDFTDSASKLHKDDVRIDLEDVRRALFPMDLDSGMRVFDRYLAFLEEVRKQYPALELPCSLDMLQNVLRAGDVNDLTRVVFNAIEDYNKGCCCEDQLVFDNVNMWIPRDAKQLVLLPLCHSCDLPYPSNEAVAHKVRTELQHHFRYSPQGSAVIFFGQSILHQALVGPESSFGSGSLEGRFLTLVPRTHALEGTLRVCVDTDEEAMLYQLDL